MIHRSLIFWAFFILPSLLFGQKKDVAVLKMEVDSLSRAVDLFMKTGNLAGALPASKAASELARSFLPPDDSILIYTLQSLALTLEMTGQFAQAEPLLFEILQSDERKFGPESAAVGKDLHQLGNHYSRQRQDEKAVHFLKKAVDLHEKRAGKSDYLYIIAIEALGASYFRAGDFDLAAQLLLETKAFKAVNPGRSSFSYGVTVALLADLFKATGQVEKSKAHYLEAIEVISKTLGKKHPNYALILNNYAGLYVDLADYAKANEVLLEARTTLIEAKNTSSPTYVTILINTTRGFLNLGDAQKAAPFLAEAEERVLEVYGQKSLDFAYILNLKAAFAATEGKKEEAIARYLEAKMLFETTLGTRSEPYFVLLHDLALAYEEAGKLNDAAASFMASIELSKAHLKNAQGFLSEQEMLGMQKRLLPYFESFSAFAHTNLSLNLGGPLFDDALFSKNSLLENSISLKKSMAAAPPAVQNDFKNWQKARMDLADELSKPLAEQRDLADLEEKANGLEKKLIRSQTAFSETRRTTNWPEIQKNLREGEAAVEFIKYVFDPDEGEKTPFYAALILLPDGLEPRFIPLFEAQKLEKKLSNRAGGPALFLKKLYAAPVAGAAEPSLFELIWQPLEPFLKATKTVFFAPVGLLHRVNLGAVGVESIGSATVVLADRFRFIQLGSTRELLKKRDFELEKMPQTAAIFGGIRYETDSVAIAEANQKMDLADAQNPETDDIAVRGGDWDFLQGAAREADETRAFFIEKGIKTAFFTGFEATEDAFSRFGKKRKAPEILHLATHGFFFSAPSETAASEAGAVFKTSENPMMRSGLLFAGANRAWRTGRAVTGARDGILTAYETSQMNLEGTRLAVLSACETGLGEVAGTEGVFGLQRAFRLAGAKAVLMSLWAAPDEKTRELMALFYQNWLEKGQSPTDALTSAQTEMRRKWPNPFFWAGFVLVGE